MKQIKLIALACCASIILFSGCKNIQPVPLGTLKLENCFNTCVLKKAAYYQKLYAISADSMQSPIFDDLVDLNEQIISDFTCQIMSLCSNCEKDLKKECCRVEECVDPECAQFFIHMPDCLTSDLEMEEFNVYDTTHVKLGEINKGAVKELREQLFYYPIKYEVDSLPSRYYVSFMEKDNPVKYIVQFVK